MTLEFSYFCIIVHDLHLLSLFNCSPFILLYMGMLDLMIDDLI